MAQSFPTQSLHGFIKKIIEKYLFPAEIHSKKKEEAKPNFHFAILEHPWSFSFLFSNYNLNVMRVGWPSTFIWKTKKEMVKDVPEIATF